MQSSTRVATYVDLRSTTRKPTGVDKHIARMVHGLAATPGFSLSFPPQSRTGFSLPCPLALTG